MSTRIIYRGIMRKPHSYDNRYTPWNACSDDETVEECAAFARLSRSPLYNTFTLMRSRRALIVTDAATAKIRRPGSIFNPLTARSFQFAFSSRARDLRGRRGRSKKIELTFSRPRKWFRDICIQSSSRCSTHKYRVIHLNDPRLNKIKYYADM